MPVLRDVRKMKIHIETELVGIDENDSSILLRIEGVYENIVTFFLNDKKYAVADWAGNIEDFFAECIRQFNDHIIREEDTEE